MFNNSQLNEIINKYRENKLSHAYLIETNNVDYAMQDLLTLIKNLNCPANYTPNCKNCSLCNLIDKASLPSLKIITPEGTSIKKSEILELKRKFETIPIYSKFNVYIIKNAERLNSSSANAMLKFVEEPTPGILGFFLTNNKDIIIDTIKSRCQILTINYEINEIKEELSLTSEEYESYLSAIKTFLDYVSKDSLLTNKSFLLNTYTERKDIEIIFKIILTIYEQHFLKALNKNYNQDLYSIIEEESLPIIIKRMNIITNTLQNLSYNVSIELALDKFVIEMRGINE